MEPQQEKRPALPPWINLVILAMTLTALYVLFVRAPVQPQSFAIPYSQFKQLITKKQRSEERRVGKECCA